MGVYIYIYILSPLYHLISPSTGHLVLGASQTWPKNAPRSGRQRWYAGLLRGTEGGIRWRPHPDRRGADRKQSQARKELGDPATATGCCCYRMVMFSNQLKCYVYIYIYIICIYIYIYTVYTNTYICIHTCRASKFGQFSWWTSDK